MSYLSSKNRIAKITAIANLKSEENDKRLAFFTSEDTANFYKRNILEQEDCEEVTDLYFDAFGRIAFNGCVLPESNTIAIDFETTGVNPYVDDIKVLGISNGQRHYYMNHHSPTWHKLKDVLQALNTNAKYKIIAYNIQFEHQFIWVNFGIDFHFHSDPMILAYNYYNKSSKDLKLSKLASELLQRFPRSLEELAGRKFTSSKPFNWEQDAEPSLTDVCCYCCEDCYETVLLQKYLNKAINRQGYEKVKGVATHIDIKATHIASKMSLRGIKIDLDKLPHMEKDIEAYIAILKDEIEAGCGWYANPKSPKQMNELLFEQLNLDASELKKSTHGYSVDAKARQLLLTQHPVVLKYDYIARCQDALNKYVGKMQDWVASDGRCHTHFNTCMTLTGRLSSSNPNLQNIPNPDKYKSTGNEFIAKIGQDIRNLFIASEGHSLIACDYSSFELRILAHLSQDPTLIQVFKQGNSLHNVMTEKLFGIVYDPNNPDHKAKRTVVKTINFGLCYGLTYKRLYEECKLRGMNWSQQDCKNIISEYWRMLDTLAYWFERQKINAIIKGYTETICGRRRYYPFSEQCKNAVQHAFTLEEFAPYMTGNDQEFLRQAGNHIIQGTNADTIRLAMIECDKLEHCNLLLQIHDELVFEVRDDYIKQACHDIKNTMENCLELNVPVIAEPKVAKQWGETK